jgi:hypothetical protein
VDAAAELKATPDVRRALAEAFLPESRLKDLSKSDRKQWTRKLKSREVPAKEARDSKPLTAEHEKRTHELAMVPKIKQSIE